MKVKRKNKNGGTKGGYHYPMRLILLLLRPIYYLLYRHFAWTYDLVAGFAEINMCYNTYYST
jgi:hypothetical protein